VLRDSSIRVACQCVPKFAYPRWGANESAGYEGATASGPVTVPRYRADRRTAPSTNCVSALRRLEESARRML
jgi:hypothetical protein